VRRRLCGPSKLQPHECIKTIPKSKLNTTTQFYTQYTKHNVNFLLHLLRIASACFEHYLLVHWRCYTNGTWYIACVLCQSAPQLVQPTLHNMIRVLTTYHLAISTRDIWISDCMKYISAPPTPTTHLS
jgi:hypothetical protein